MQPRGALVFLHGSGGNGSDTRSFLESICLPSYRHDTFASVLRSWNIELYTPTAKVRKYSPCYGEKMNVWYDRSARFQEEGLATAEDIDGVDQSIEYIKNYIHEIEETRPFDYLILGGFSMGGGLALHSYRRDIHPKLESVFCISSWASDPSAIFKDPLSSHRGAPLLMLHGESDRLIFCDWGRKTSAGLLIRDINVNFFTYPGVDHEIIPQELEHLLDWFKELRQEKDSFEQRAEKRSQRLDAKYERLEKELIDETADQSIGARPCRIPVSSSKLSDFSESKRSDIGSSRTAEDKDENRGYICISECLPYKIEATAAAAPIMNRTYSLREVIVKFRLESEYVPILLTRPVLACGSMFEILDDRPNGVKVHVTSPDVEKTAYEIGRRLFIRLRSESQSLNPCSPS